MQPPVSGAAEGVSRTAQVLASQAAAALQRADKALKANRARDALNGYESILAIFPEHAEATAGARSARQALTAQNQSRDVQASAKRHYAAGAECYRKGDLAGTLREWEAALAAMPQDAALKAELARVRSQAEEEREKLRRRAQARYEDGLAAYQRGEVDGALAAWKETLEMDSEHEKARANIRRVEREMR